MPEASRLPFGGYGLGIVAPDAFERTSFHEERSADSRPVVDRHAFSVEHERRFHGASGGKKRSHRECGGSGDEFFPCCRHFVDFIGVKTMFL